MFSDTHFHFTTMTQERNIDGTFVLEELSQRDCFFALDIGTKSQDLLLRYESIQNSINKIENQTIKDKINNMIFYSAGIWPSVEEIHSRFDSVLNLEKMINQFTNQKKIVAIGECGLDHHWNPSGEDGRCKDDFDQKTFEAEKELFELQLKLAKQKNLPVIIHSREAFLDTLDCIKNMGYHNGIIHCFSYGIEEARAFLDLGWYIALGGAITYTKKTKIQEMEELIKYIPQDRLLLETDAPYLAPVPFRGQVNTPVLVEHVYEYISKIINITKEELSNIVDNNIKSLFNL